MEENLPECFNQVNKFSDQYPQNTKPLENQVAGHTFSAGHFTIGMLKDDEGNVLKPVNKVEQGKREIMFYETVTCSSAEELKQLRQFIPTYFGISTLTVNGRSAQFLKLSDATKGYTKPCVMDVKMGRQTWEPGAPRKKQQREEAKYAVCKQQCGFCIPGFQVCNYLTGKVDKYGKEFGKQLTKENIPGVLKTFLNVESRRSRFVAQEILHQLLNILSWWQTQHVYHMYSSSVLLTYDADTLDPSLLKTNSCDIKTCVRVLLIDFAHVVPASGTLDYNYLNGLEHFVEIFKSVIDDL